MPNEVGKSGNATAIFKYGEKVGVVSFKGVPIKSQEAFGQNDRRRTTRPIQGICCHNLVDAK
jgi:hypothetical protein